MTDILKEFHNTKSIVNTDQLHAAVYRQLFELGNSLLKEKDMNRLLSVAMDMAIKMAYRE